ncbi:MAG: DNA alkylation repair enzyme [Rikenellaceae bacterium]|nr:DNA alkylation repair enzyme [Rikenellaceae bacterium]
MDTKMENHTSRMAALMGRLRREMNGAVVESMQRAGVRGALNYGVSIPTIREIASQTPPDHTFARFLYRQQVRELRLAAATIAEPEALTPEELMEWVEGIDHLEILDEVALRLFSRAPHAIHHFMAEQWLCGAEPMPCYVALMTLNRTAYPPQEVMPRLSRALERFASERNVARAALAYCTFHFDALDLEQLPDTESGRFVREELCDLFGCR